MHACEYIVLCMYIFIRRVRMYMCICHVLMHAYHVYGVWTRMYGYVCIYYAYTNPWETNVHMHVCKYVVYGCNMFCMLCRDVYVHMLHICAHVMYRCMLMLCTDLYLWVCMCILVCVHMLHVYYIFTCMFFLRF